MGSSLSRKRDAIPTADLQLVAAAAAGDLPGVRTALRNGANICCIPRFRWEFPHSGTPLHAACARGHWAVARFLLEQGADPNAPSPVCRYTPLQMASAQGHLVVVDELLQRGAVLTNDADSIRTGKTPLDQAKSAGHGRVAALLLRHYQGSVHEREGPLSLHVILRKAFFAYSRLLEGGIFYTVNLPVGELSKAEMVDLLRGFVEQDLTVIRANRDSRLSLHK